MTIAVSNISTNSLQMHSQFSNRYILSFTCDMKHYSNKLINNSLRCQIHLIITIYLIIPK